MNTVKCFGQTLELGSRGTGRANRAVPIRTLFLMVALATLVCFGPVRALAYGDYEERISGQHYVRDNILSPLPNLDAPQLFSQAFFTPPPVDDDTGLAAIEGSLNPASGDSADMYCIFIGGRFRPQDFVAVMEDPLRPPAGQTRIVNPQLFLFDLGGHPVVGNDNTSPINFDPTIPAGTITQAGIYILAITGAGFDPTDADGNALFTDNSTGLKTPTNPDAVQAGWSGEHTQSGRYRIHLGMNEHWPVSEVPEPNTFALLLLGGLALWRNHSAGRFQRKSEADSN